MLDKLRAIYNEVLSQALNQMILPFPMFVTQSAVTKQVILDSLNISDRPKRPGRSEASTNNLTPGEGAD